MSKQNTVSLNILGKEYKIICTEDEQADLITSAQQLDLQMREIRHSGKVSGGEKVAVLAALNLTHELVQSKGNSTPSTSVTPGLAKKLNKMYFKIETALKNV